MRMTFLGTDGRHGCDRAGRLRQRNAAGKSGDGLPVYVIHS